MLTRRHPRQRLDRQYHLPRLHQPVVQDRIRRQDRKTLLRKHTDLTQPTALLHPATRVRQGLLNPIPRYRQVLLQAPPKAAANPPKAPQVCVPPMMDAEFKTICNCALEAHKRWMERSETSDLGPHLDWKWVMDIPGYIEFKDVDEDCTTNLHWSYKKIGTRYKQLSAICHPDKLCNHCFVEIATDCTVIVIRAWELAKDWLAKELDYINNKKDWGIPPQPRNASYAWQFWNNRDGPPHTRTQTRNRRRNTAPYHPQRSWSNRPRTPPRESDHWGPSGATHRQPPPPRSSSGASGSAGPTPSWPPPAPAAPPAPTPEPIPQTAYSLVKELYNQSQNTNMDLHERHRWDDELAVALAVEFGHLSQRWRNFARGNHLRNCVVLQRSRRPNGWRNEDFETPPPIPETETGAGWNPPESDPTLNFVDLNKPIDLTGLHVPLSPIQLQMPPQQPLNQWIPPRDRQVLLQQPQTPPYQRVPRRIHKLLPPRHLRQQFQPQTFTSRGGSLGETS